jgi:hypothetical protein
MSQKLMTQVTIRASRPVIWAIATGVLGVDSPYPAMWYSRIQKPTKLPPQTIFFAVMTLKRPCGMRIVIMFGQLLELVSRCGKVATSDMDYI